jgi:hypothetical protein
MRRRAAVEPVIGHLKAEHRTAELITAVRPATLVVTKVWTRVGFSAPR